MDEHPAHTDPHRQEPTEPMSHREIRRPHRSRSSYPSWLWPMLAAAVVIGLIVGIIYSIRPAPQVSTPAVQTPVVTGETTPSAPPSNLWRDGDMPENAVAGDGNYRVGTDIPIGRYETAGPSDPDAARCYYAIRRPGVDDPADSFIDSRRTAGQAVVTLKQNQIFETAGCNPWHKVA